MSLFGKLVKTTINVGVGLPVALLKDYCTMGGVCTDQKKPYMSQMLEQIKKEADE